jgi:hypothetical protein
MWDLYAPHQFCAETRTEGTQAARPVGTGQRWSTRRSRVCIKIRNHFSTGMAAGGSAEAGRAAVRAPMEAQLLPENKQWRTMVAVPDVVFDACHARFDAGKPFAVTGRKDGTNRRWKRLPSNLLVGVAKED